MAEERGRTPLRYVTATVRYVAYWQDGQTGRTTSLTHDEYRALGAKGAGEPPGKPRPSAVFVQAQAELVWNTASGNREPGDVTDQFLATSGTIEVIAPDGKRQAFPAEECVGDVRNPQAFTTTTVRNNIRMITGEVDQGARE